jgi:hypothetical protein
MSPTLMYAWGSAGAALGAGRGGNSSKVRAARTCSRAPRARPSPKGQRAKDVDDGGEPSHEYAGWF